MRIRDLFYICNGLFSEFVATPVLAFRPPWVALSGSAGLEAGFVGAAAEFGC